MNRAASGSYVCWRCLSKSLQPRASLVKRPYSVTANRCLRAHSAFPTSRSIFEPAEKLKQVTSVHNPKSLQNVPTIRDRLRQWEAENPNVAPSILRDNADPGLPRNLLTRARNINEIINDDEMPGSKLEQPFLDNDGAVDALPGPTDIRPGDLFEDLPDGDRVPFLAVCLGYFHGFYHIYTISGMWKVVRKIRSQFVVRNFISSKMLQPLCDVLPKEKMTYQELRIMETKNMGPNRIQGAAVLRKLAEFQLRTDELQQQHGMNLEKAHEVVAAAGDRYATLTLVAARMHAHFKKGIWQHPVEPPMLYALHRNLSLDDLGFRAVGTLSDATQWLYEVTPAEDVSLVQNMQTLVRLLTDLPAKVDTPLSALTNDTLQQSQLGRFIIKAREAIDYSRKFRDWTPHGLLGPSKETMPAVSTTWTQVDISIMHFMLLWSGRDHFSLFSRYHWIGSAILRAVGRYNDSEYLSATVGWNFLQELGYVSPWDLHDRYTHRVPGVETSRTSGFERLPLGPEGIKPYITPDALHEIRHDWAEMKAFAIDSKDTTDIDDAISLEKTDVPGEHWVHIHVADPASRIRHQCALGERASQTPLTLYLSGHYTNMWGVGDEVQKLFSLGPDMPCLTFSAKVNLEGDMLDYKITPAKLQNLVYMTPDDANTALGIKPSEKLQRITGLKTFSIGQPPVEKPAARKLTSPSELQPDEAESLHILHQISGVIHQKRLAKGAVPSYSLKPKVHASFDNTSVQRAPLGLMSCSGDPYISIRWDDSESALVSSLMQLAGEVAGRWCADRKMPMPYVVQPLADQNLELAKAYADQIYYPYLHRGEPVPDEVWTQFRHLIGDTQFSSQPGTNFLMGMDAYIKVTSPLRRYSDLLAHWQIESALLQEKTKGATALSQLPFFRKTLEKDVFPILKLREGIIKRLGNVRGNEAYIRQALLRAWKFPDNSVSPKLPDTFKFTVQAVLGASSGGGWRHKLIVGTLDFFSLRVWLLPEGLSHFGVALTEVQPGDEYEVELSDINAHTGDVFVKATRKIRVLADEMAKVEIEVPEHVEAEKLEQVHIEVLEEEQKQQR
ncbi:hypothetical protein BD289DRAFT_406261 [Coniella lustricola]|uniref:RNB domain-containing protein n=1 Tax=Coniella lustricola TaxID=2025994 RepID=A0A2T3ACW0_9PEZI|nr:hypothetical protein BD289DRAFT_406261 [Coniella lustricola]